MPTVIERINAGLESDTPGRVEWRTLLETALFEIERLQRCHRIIAKQVGFYKPELPGFTKVEIYLGVLRAAERCAGLAPWESDADEAVSGDRTDGSTAQPVA